MPEIPRAKGQFSQPGEVKLFPKVGGSIVSHDGTLAMDAVYDQEDYPVLVEVIGTNFNDAGKGDDPATQFRTPPTTTEMSTLAGTEYEWRIRY